MGKLFRIVYSSLVCVILILLVINILGLRGREGFNEQYITFYTWVLLAGVVFGVLFLFMDFYSAAFAKNEYASFGFIYETSKFRLLSLHPLLRYGSVAVFTVLIILTVTVGKIQIFPTPEPFASGHAPTEWQRAYYISVPVGIGEDFVFNFVAPIAVTALMMGVFWLFTQRNLRADNLGDIIIYFVMTVFASLFSAFVYFMLTHEKAYGANTAAYVSAFIFSFLTCMLYLHTGFFFFGIPHIAHNFLFAVGLVVATLNLGAISPMIAIVRHKWFEFKTRKCLPKSRPLNGS